MGDLAGFEHIAVVGGFERGARVLLDQQDRDAELAQRSDDAEDLAHDQRREPEARLVEHQQPRLRHQRAAERQHLPLAARQRAAQAAAAARRGAGSARRRRRRSRCTAAGRAGAYRRRGQGCPRPSSRRTARGVSGTRQRPRSTRSSTSSAREIVAVVDALAPRDGSRPISGRKQRGLAGAVRADHGDDLARPASSRLTPRTASTLP